MSARLALECVLYGSSPLLIFRRHSFHLFLTPHSAARKGMRVRDIIYAAALHISSTEYSRASYIPVEKGADLIAEYGSSDQFDYWHNERLNPNDGSYLSGPCISEENADEPVTDLISHNDLMSQDDLMELYTDAEESLAALSVGSSQQN